MRASFDAVNLVGFGGMIVMGFVLLTLGRCLKVSARCFCVRPVLGPELKDFPGCRC